MTNEFFVVWTHKDRLLAGFGNTIWLCVLATAIALLVAGPITVALMSHNRSLRVVARGKR